MYLILCVSYDYVNLLLLLGLAAVACLNKYTEPRVGL